MNVLGYGTGPIECEAAFTADFDVPSAIAAETLVKKIETDRIRMAARSGMRSKYVPFRFEPATGAYQIGGRYLFETWSDLTDYVRFTEEEMEFAPGIPFWKGPLFANVEKLVWRVIGAHDFTPISTHCVTRTERFKIDGLISEEELGAVWSKIVTTAKTQDLASIWFLKNPRASEVALITSAQRSLADDVPRSASSSIANLEQAPSLIKRFLHAERMLPLFARTSLTLTSWLPLSASLGGDASVFPWSDLYPVPTSLQHGELVSS